MSPLVVLPGHLLEIESWKNLFCCCCWYFALVFTLTECCRILKAKLLTQSPSYVRVGYFLLHEQQQQRVLVYYGYDFFPSNCSFGASAPGGPLEIWVGAAAADENFR